METFRTPAALAIATFLCLVFATTAQAQDEDGSIDAESGGDAAEATVAVYRVEGVGRWEDVPETLSIMTAPRIPFIDADGFVHDAHPVIVDRPNWHNGSWVQVQEQRFYAHDGTWLARVVEHEEGSEPDSIVPGVVGARSGHAQVMAYMRGIEDCLMIPSHHNSYRCIMPFWPEAVWTATRARNEWSDRDAPTVVVQARWGDWLLESWHAPDVPVAARVEVVAIEREGISSLTLTLDEHREWGQGEPSDPERVLDPIANVAATQSDTVLFAPSEAGLQHSFPLSAAVRILMDDDVVTIDARGEQGCGSDGPTFEEWLETYPQPFVYHAEHRLLAGDREGHEWLLGFSNAHNTFWMVVARVDDAALRGPDLARAVCGDVINSAFGSVPIGDYAVYIDPPTHIDPHVPGILDVRGHLPSARQLVEWWEAISGQDAPADPSYGYHIGCTGCAPRTWSFWAGTAVANTTHDDPVSFHLGYEDSLAYNATLLHLDDDGRATSLVQTGYDESFRIPGLPSLPGQRSAMGGNPDLDARSVGGPSGEGHDAPAEPASGLHLTLAGVGLVVVGSLATALLRRQR